MYNSFLVRVWRDDDAEQDTGWQAEVQQIQNGESWNFRNPEALLAFLHKLVDDEGWES
jgi:hypothetical protein